MTEERLSGPEDEALASAGYTISVDREDNGIPLAAPLQHAEIRRVVRHEMAPLRAHIRKLKAQLRSANARLAEADRRRGEPRYGMHIDGFGDYWMLRHDGWHYCRIDTRPNAESPEGKVQRLVEPKDRYS